jgi:hypothetical protein
LSTRHRVLDRADSAWSPLTEEERCAVWSDFERRFSFRASVHPVRWAGINEPGDSRTYAIGHVYGDEAEYDRLTMDLCEKLHAAFRRCSGPAEAVWVLDWQHDCYRFWPGRPFCYDSEEDWSVPPLPNGDYRIFLANDLRFGVFGHPWEQTMCVFGRPLLEAIDAAVPELFGAPIRVGGRTV